MKAVLGSMRDECGALRDEVCQGFASNGFLRGVFMMASLHFWGHTWRVSWGT